MYLSEVTLETGDSILAAVFGFFIGIFLLYYGFTMYRRYQLIRDTPTSNVQSMPVGTVELKGEVEKVSDEHTYKDPLENKECVFYYRKVEEYSPDDDGSDWDTVLEEEVGDKFYLNDDTGRVIVNVEDPDRDLENEARKREKMRVDPNEGDIPRAVQGTRAENTSDIIPDFLESKKYRVTVEAIHPGMEIYLFGHARTRDVEESFATNEKNIVVGNPENASSNEVSTSLPLLGNSKPFIIANQKEEDLIKERKWLGPASFFGGLLLSAGCLAYLLLLFGV